MTTTLILLAAAATAPYSCPDVFNEVVSATETNYAGYVIKLPDDNARETYHRFNALLADRAAQAGDHAACRDVLQAYVGFFADHHLFILSRENPDSPIPSLKQEWNRENTTDYLKQHQAMLDPVEGTWFDAQGQIAVIHDSGLAPGQYVAIRTSGDAAGEPLALIERQAGAYRIAYQDERWGWQEADANLRRNGGLFAFGVKGWGRTGAERLNADDPMAPYFSGLGDGIYYLSMPSFMDRYRAHVARLVEEKGEVMANASGLVIDIRGNGGGSAIYFKLAPYFLANDIEVSDSSSILASKWNLEHMERIRKRLGEHGAFLDQPLAAMREHPGEIVPYQEGRVDGMPEYPEKPERVVVLQDRGVGSAGEAFIYHAGQSRKVVTMGEPTRGNIDYMRVNMHEVGETDFRYWFGYPLYFDRSVPEDTIDDEGYAPDVRLNLPQDEWLDFAVAWLLQKGPGDSEPTAATDKENQPEL